MAKKQTESSRGRRARVPQSSSAKGKIKKVMHEYKYGELRMGRSGKKVKSRRQAVAIGLSEARRKNKK